MITDKYMEGYELLAEKCPSARLPKDILANRTLSILNGGDPNTLTISRQMGSSDIYLTGPDDEEDLLWIPVKASGAKVVVESLAPDFVPDTDIVYPYLNQLGGVLEENNDELVSTLGAIVRSLARTTAEYAEQRDIDGVLVFDNDLLAVHALRENINKHMGKQLSSVTMIYPDIYAAGIDDQGVPFILDAAQTRTETGKNKSSSLDLLLHTPYTTTSIDMTVGPRRNTDSLQARETLCERPAYLQLANPGRLYTRQELVDAAAEARIDSEQARRNAEEAGSSADEENPLIRIDVDRHDTVRRLNVILKSIIQVSADPDTLFTAR